MLEQDVWIGWKTLNSLFFFFFKKEQKPQRPDKTKERSNAYLQQGVGHTGGLVSSPLCFLV